jgi:exosortase/archaeosortase family protein
LLIPAVLVINWLRLVILAAVRFYTPSEFDFVHVYLFQPAMIAFTLIIFLLWVVSPNDRVDKS